VVVVGVRGEAGQRFEVEDFEPVGVRDRALVSKGSPRGAVAAAERGGQVRVPVDQRERGRVVDLVRGVERLAFELLCAVVRVPRATPRSRRSTATAPSVPASGPREVASPPRG
jgi:hypothetical protein